MDNKAFYNYVMPKIRKVIEDEINHDYTLSDYTHRNKTMILNRSYANGKVHAYLELIDDYCGIDYMIKAKNEVQDFIDDSIKICDSIYQYLGR